MFIVESYTTAILFCFITMICWGSWANMQKLNSGTWRFELFYWDYVIGILLFSILFAFTAGSMGMRGRAFIPDLAQADPANLLSAFTGGVLFNLANILLVAAIAIAGMSVAFPTGIGIALILGVVVNYLAKPEGDPRVLFSGVLLIAIAILLNANAYRRLNRKTSNFSMKGLVIAIPAGIMLGFFYKYVAVSMVSDQLNPEPGKLTPYTALVSFAVGIFVSNFIFNSFIMYKPFVGGAIPWSAWFKGSFKDHAMGIIGGVIWNLGMSLNILAAAKASPAISYGLGQGATVIAAIWGIFIWKEFKNADRRTNNQLYIMLALYVAGIALLIIARS
ncbi:glucose uptake protein [Pedobacter sp. AK017]|uniref:GRP family sugar transporter n=1 Tax=Pedobacter sp. AK017 TaxID=2723073 RepID=UPI0016172192|nr:GRP family sugar transporter [Pedobacter sp. AK017]MBB5438990.1 glucose uptake protein [Pedobacter sp. AK017]